MRDFMFFRNRQQKFPEEFRIYDFKWDYESILDALNRESQDVSNLKREFAYLESKIVELENEADFITAVGYKLLF